ncbi:MAG: hypothetical protein JWN66_3258 [Sphingomonas bacterium]|nr:benenodin family lasso peptide [Sphingomonas bacterium]MDB5706142.1 hypothetical protein [Sphingomonas bacterium]
MEKTTQRREDDVVDLGIASVETKGPGIGVGDDAGLQDPAGLSAD